uniref:Uncharacterized protein n=1 Tax=Candidatus Kentrum sp. TC TaxID=2126339 RepID=A0A450YJL8_9GAMM|nr:MAG: hypothetical protein BECKTC1821E_GA0114239_101347 [Candidatus Kentron sp. TC]
MGFSLCFLKIALAIRRRQHLDSVDDVRVIHWDYTRSSYANPNSLPSRDDRIPDIRNQHQPVRYTRIVDFFYLIPLGFAGFLPYPGIRAELPTCFIAVCSVFIGIAPSFPILVGKGEAPATPSPLPRGGQFPPFTDVPVSGIGRLRPEYPLRGVICFDLRRLMIEVGQAQ